MFADLSKLGMLIERIDALLGIVNSHTANETHCNSFNNLVDFTQHEQQSEMSVPEKPVSSNKTLQK